MIAAWLPQVSLVMFMIGMGLALTVQDFRVSLANPRALGIGVIAQVLGLPFCAVMIALAFNLPTEIALGVIIISICPGGPSSNFFTWLVRGDVPLALSLTTITSLLSLVTVPFFFDLAVSVLSEDKMSFSLSAASTIIQIFSLVVLPTAIGMGLRYLNKPWLPRLASFLRRTALAMLAVIVVDLIYQKWPVIQNDFSSYGLAVCLLILFSMALGSLLSIIFKLQSTQRRTIVIEVAIQNAVQGIVIATSPFLLNRPELAVVPTAYAILMYPTVGLYLLVCRYFDRGKELS